MAPYVYASASDRAAVVALIDALASGQRRRHRLHQRVAGRSALSPVAGDAEREARLARALARVRVAAIGPIVVEALAARGARIDVVPEKNFVMRRLVNALAESLGPKA